MARTNRLHVQNITWLFCSITASMYPPKTLIETKVASRYNHNNIEYNSRAGKRTFFNYVMTKTHVWMA